MIGQQEFHNEENTDHETNIIITHQSIEQGQHI